MKKSSLITGGIVSAAVLVAVNAFAQVGTQSAAGIQTDASGTVVTYGSYYNGNYPVITAVLDSGGTLNGLTYSGKDESFLAYDGSGSLEFFGIEPGSPTLSVGEGIGITSIKYSPYEGLPELATNASTAFTLYPSSGGNVNTVPAPVTATVATLNTDAGLLSANGTLPNSVAGNLIVIDNVTIGLGTNLVTTFGIKNLTLTATDITGSAALYYYVTDDELANQNLYGTTIPTGPVDIEGVETVFDGAAEIDLLAIVPEPGTLALCGAGAAVLALFVFRSRKTA
ncbi:MAG: PEP-CTERM sorting domain-containing protein [Verrucomicrobiota bacterium]|jgi:hypothetical protein